MNKKERNNSWIYLIIISVLTVGVIALISIILNKQSLLYLYLDTMSPILNISFTNIYYEKNRRMFTYSSILLHIYMNCSNVIFSAREFKSRLILFNMFSNFSCG